MTRSSRFSPVLSAIVLALATDVASSAEPPVGSPQRLAVLAALRPAVEADLTAPIGFRVSRIDVLGGWAYVSCIPTRGPVPLDWSRTRYAEAFAKDMMSNMVLGLLRLGPDGRWQVVEYALGPTDAAWEEWIPRHGLPRSLFVPANPAEERDPETAPIETADAPPVAPTAPAGTGSPQTSAGGAAFGDVDAALEAALSSGSSRPAAPPAPTPTPPPPRTATPQPPAVMSSWAVPPGNTGYEAMPAARSRTVAANGGVGAVTLGARAPAVFSLLVSHRIEQVMTYHYGAQRRPGTIALQHESGTVYGPWQAAGGVGQGNVRDAYWWVRPEVVVPRGRYTVVDSDPRTWAWEEKTRGAGIFAVWGQSVR